VAAQHSAAPIRSLGGKSMGPGWNFCSDCRQKLTVRVGTLYERSHILLHKWLMATHLVVSSKKGMSAMQLGRMLGITYKSARFMCHRRRTSFAASLSNTEAGDARRQLSFIIAWCQSASNGTFYIDRANNGRNQADIIHFLRNFPSQDGKADALCAHGNPDIAPKHALGGNCGAQGPITTPSGGFAV
jgi:hypothetical protein